MLIGEDCERVRNCEKSTGTEVQLRNLFTEEKNNIRNTSVQRNCGTSSHRSVFLCLFLFVKFSCTSVVSDMFIAFYLFCYMLQAKNNKHKTPKIRGSFETLVLGQSNGNYIGKWKNHPLSQMTWQQGAKMVNTLSHVLKVMLSVSSLRPIQFCRKFPTNPYYKQIYNNVNCAPVNFDDNQGLFYHICRNMWLH